MATTGAVSTFSLSPRRTLTQVGCRSCPRHGVVQHCTDFMNTAELAGREFDAEKWNVKLLDAQTRQVYIDTTGEEQQIEVWMNQKLSTVNVANLSRCPRTRECCRYRGGRPGRGSPQSNSRNRKTRYCAVLLYLSVPCCVRTSWSGGDTWPGCRRATTVPSHLTRKTYRYTVRPELPARQYCVQFWRQLWRVVERSDLVIQIVDCRHPLLFRCEVSPTVYFIALTRPAGPGAPGDRDQSTEEKLAAD